MEEVQIAVGGMSCGGCVRSVTQVLTGMAGVASAEVSLADARATVKYDPALVTPAAMAAAIRDAGFDAA